MNIEFFVALGITLFSAGIVFGILKTDLKHLSSEYGECKTRLDRIVEDGSPRVKNLESRIQEMIRRDEEHEQAMQQFNKTLTKIESGFEALSKKIDELARDVKELNRGRVT